MNQKTRLAKLLDNLSLYLVLFIFSVAIFSRFLNSKTSTVVVSIFLSLVVFLSILKVIKTRNIHHELTHSEIKKLENTINALKFGDPKKIKQFWKNCLSKTYTTTINGDFLKISNDTTSALVYFNFSENKIPNSIITDLIKKNKTNLTLFILAPDFSEDSKTLAENNKKIKLLDKHAVFNYLNKINYFPTLPQKKLEKISKKSKLKSILKKENSFKFIRYGLLLILISFIIPYSLLYKITGTILILLGIISIFKKTPATTLTQNILL